MFILFISLFYFFIFFYLFLYFVYLFILFIYLFYFLYRGEGGREGAINRDHFLVFLCITSVLIARDWIHTMLVPSTWRTIIMISSSVTWKLVFLILWPNLFRISVKIQLGEISKVHPPVHYSIVKHETTYK